MERKLSSQLSNGKKEPEKQSEVVDYVKYIKAGGKNQKRLSIIDQKYQAESRKSIKDQAAHNAQIRSSQFLIQEGTDEEDVDGIKRHLFQQNFQQNLQKLAKEKQIKEQTNPLNRQYEFPPDIVLKNKIRKEKEQVEKKRASQIHTPLIHHSKDPQTRKLERMQSQKAVDTMPNLRSNLLHNLLVCMHLKEHIKVVSDLAFDAVDDDGSGGLDQGEIAEIMKEVAIKMDLTPPTEDDLSAILAELDEDYDGVVDKGEFLNLIMLVIGKMLESEEELQEKVNEEVHNEMRQELDQLNELKM